MRHWALPAGVALLMLAGCGGGSDRAQDKDLPEGIDSAITAYNDSVRQAATRRVPDSAAQRRSLRIVAGDTLHATISYRCAPELIASVGYWNGPGSRVMVSLADTVISLPQVRSADGARYALQRPAIEWWEKGDSATFTRNGKRHHCGADSTVEF